MRPAATLPAAPVAVQASMRPRSAVVRWAYSAAPIPANTPARLPRSVRGGRPACSRDSQQTSSRIRCCGSMAAASAGGMPKNAASNPATSPSAPARLVTEASAAPAAGEPSSNASHRPAGTSVTPSPPPRRNSQKAPGPCTVPARPPGKRQPIPMTATGTSAGRGGAGWPAGPAPASALARPLTVGYSQTSVGGSGRSSSISR